MKILQYINTKEKLKGFESLEEKANKLKVRQGQEIAFLMKEKGVTWDMIVEHTKVSKTTISGIIKGTTNYTVDSLNRVKVYLGNV